MTSNVQLVPTTSVDALNKTLDTPPLDPVVLAIANDFLSGKSIEEMSDEYYETGHLFSLTDYAEIIRELTIREEQAK